MSSPYTTLSVLLAGGMAGITTDLILYPLDTLKTLRQVRNSGGAAAPRLPQTFYRGLLTQMVGSFPCSAMFWIIYERVLVECTRPGLSTLQALAPGIASTVGECAVCTLRNPFDVVKQQLQAGMHKSTAQALANILREEGVRGLYAGYQSALIRDLPFAAIQYTAFEFSKRTARAWKGSDTLSFVETAPLSALSGALAGSITTPLDVVKTRLMTQAGGKDRYKGWWDALSRVYREEGVAVLFSGVRTRTAWITSGAVIYLGSYEEFKKMVVGK